MRIIVIDSQGGWQIRYPSCALVCHHVLGLAYVLASDATTLESDWDQLCADMKRYGVSLDTDHTYDAGDGLDAYQGTVSQPDRKAEQWH